MRFIDYIYQKECLVWNLGVQICVLSTFFTLPYGRLIFTYGKAFEQALIERRQ
jgi:hypothetical protein